MIRICRRISIYPTESLFEAIHKACLSRFMPNLARNALMLMLAEAGIEPPPRVAREAARTGLADDATASAEDAAADAVAEAAGDAGEAAPAAGSGDEG